MNLTILMMTILTKKGFISSDPGSSVSHARLPPSFFNSEVLQKENFPIKQKKRQFPVIGNRRDKNTYYSADLDGMIMLIGNHTFPTEEQGFF